MADPRVNMSTTPVAANNVTAKLTTGQPLAIIAPPPITINGCTLPPPPVVITIGPFQFNILDWQRAAKSNTKSMTFRGGVDPSTKAWLADAYASLSKTAFQRVVLYLKSQVTMPGGITGKFKVDIANRTLKMFQPTGGWASFSPLYRGWSADANLPGGDALDFLAGIKPDMFWIWRELIDGGAPIAKVDPPFGDAGHKWGLYVKWTEQTTNGLPQVIVTLKQIPQDWLAKLEYEIAHVISVGLEYLCKAITWDKLQSVRNFGTLFPNPTVQASVLAWQGVAQACGTKLPDTASGPPACIPTEPPGMTMPWWKKYQGWLIAAGVVTVGLGGVAFYHARSAR